MKINATLHCHGAWTDYASGKFDIERFPRDIERLADVAIAKGLDLVGLTDISGKQVCEVYRPLVEGAKPDRYYIRPGETSTVMLRKQDGKPLVFGRSLEILSNDAHVLVLGTSKNILGARPLDEVVEEVASVGAVAVADHPCYTIKLGKGMGAERVRKYKQEGKLAAVEINANIARVLEAIGHYNRAAMNLGEELNMPVIANCDGNTAKDMGRMFTTYDFDRSLPLIGTYDAVLRLISSAKFADSRIKLNGKPKPFVSLPLHVARGMYSILRAKMGWIEKGLPAC